MDLQGQLDTLDAFVRHHNTQPLSLSSKRNTEQVSDTKDIESASNSILSKRLAEKSVDPMSVSLITKALKCQYILPQCNKQAVFKKHQVFVINLIENKMFHSGLQQLHSLLQQFNKHLHSQHVHSQFSLAETLQGVAFDSESDNLALVHLIVSFNFLTLQCLLQYISQNLKGVCMQTDELVNLQTWRMLSGVFLNDGNLMSWLNKASELNSPNSSKYNSSLLKLIKGFVKISDILISKKVNVQSSRDALVLKLIQLSPQEAQLIETVAVRDSLAPFIVDLNNPSLLKKLKPSTLNELTAQLHAFLQSPTLEQLQILNLKLISCSNFMTDDSVVKLINWFPLKVDPVSFNYINTVSMSIYTAATQQKRLSKNHLVILDPFTIFLKENYPSSEKYVDLISTSLSLLYKIYKEFNQFKRIRNLSNLFFHIGIQFNSASSLKLSIDYELFIYTFESTSENLLNLTSKAVKVARILADRNLIENSSEILLKLLTILGDSEESFESQSSSFDNPALIQAISKCLPVPSFVSELSRSIKSEPYKVTIVLNMFLHIEKHTNNSMQKSTTVNSLVQHLDINDSKLRGLVHYEYYNINGVDTLLDLDVPECESLILKSGIYLQKLVNLEWDEHNLMKAIELAVGWIGQECDRTPDPFEFSIFKQLLLYLKFNGLTGYAIHLIQSIDNSTLNPEQQVFLSIELCAAVSKLSLEGSQDMFTHLNNLNSLLKTLKVNSIIQVLNFNLLQLDYFVKTNKSDLACDRFTKILKILKSRSEFNLIGGDTPSNIKLTDKLSNLLLIAKVQVMASKLNTSLGHHFESFNCIKIAIKVLYSIIKKTSSNISKEFYNALKWETVHLLFESYNIIMQILQKLGITRDFVYYLNEFKKINNLNNIPLINCINYYQLVVYNLFLDKSEEVDSLIEKAQEYLKFTLVKDNLTILTFANGINKLIKGEEYHDLPIAANSVNGIEPSDLLNIYTLDQNLIPWKYLFGLKNIALSQPKSSTLSDSLIDSRFNLHNILTTVKRSPYLSELAQSIKVLPTIVSEGLIDKSMMNIDVIDKLLNCKQMLLSFISTKSLSHFNLYEIRDLNMLMNHCLSLIASMTIFKLNTSLLIDLYYLQDFTNTLPFRNDRALSHGSSGLTDLLPSNVSRNSVELEDFAMLSVNFNIDLNLHLPDNWSIVSLDICPNSGDLLMSKFVKGVQPFFIRLPMKRFSGRGGHLDIQDFGDIKSEFKEIIKQSDLSTKSVTTSKIQTKEDRKKWWKLRFSLDIRMKDLLDHVEQYWFGGFKCLFNNHKNDLVFSKFRQDLMKLINSVLPSRKNYQSKYMEFDDNLINAFYNLKSYQREEVDDLIYYIVNQLAFHGEKNSLEEINFEKFHKSVAILFDKYFNLRSSLKKEHIVLIPSAKCSFFPWESLQCLQAKSVSRMPSVQMLIDLLILKQPSLSIKNEKLYYMINPGGDLKRTEEKFKKAFQDEKNWGGLVGQKPSDDSEFLDHLLSTDLFVYLGHGGCDQYIRTSTLYKKCLPSGPILPPSLLIGCSSGALQTNGILEPSGNVYNWLTCGSPMVLVNLWDVTDKDIDQFSLAVFEHWGLFRRNARGPKMSICEATFKSRSCCNLTYLNGAAPVVYGLPLYLE